MHAFKIFASHVGPTVINSPLDTEHLAERLFVAMRHLKVLPLCPESLLTARVTERRDVHQNRPRAIDLSEFPLQLGVSANK